MKTFEILKEKLMSAPVLKHPDNSKEYHIILYANAWSIAAVVGQKYDGIIHPIQFVSRTLKAAERNRHIVEREILALLRVLHVCYTYLSGKKLYVYTRQSTFAWYLKADVAGNRANQFSILLQGWNIETIKSTSEFNALTGLLAASVTPPELLDEYFEELAPTKVKLPDGITIKAQWIPKDYKGVIMSFDGGGKTNRESNYGAFVFWEFPEWKPIAIGVITRMMGRTTKVNTTHV